MNTAIGYLAAHPFGTAFAIGALALLLRIVDIFALRLDERWGEIILSKSVGMLLVFAYAWTVRGGPAGIGLHSRRVWSALTIAGGGMIVLFVLAYGIQLVRLLRQGVSPTLVIAPIDPKAGAAGGAAFALFLLLGNVINSFMEEGLFRGIALPLFITRLGFWRANLAQAALFAAWHLVWPVKHLVSGQATLGAAMSEGVALFAATFIAGTTYGYLFHVTGSLWTPWLAHTLNNSVYNFIHLRTVAGLDAGIVVVQAIGTIGLLLLMAVVGLITRFGGGSPR